MTLGLRSAITLAIALAGGLDLPPLEPLPSVDLGGLEPTVATQIREVQSAIEEAASQPDADAQQLADLYGHLGRIHLAYNRPQAATVALRNARTLDARDGRWPYYLGVALHDMRSDAEAEAAFRAVLAEAPADLPTLLRLGRIALVADRSDDAAGWFRRALQVDPRSAAALFGLGQVEQSTGRPQEAVDLYLQALELQPEASAAHYQLAIAYRDLGSTAEAQEHMSQRGNRDFTFADPLMDDLDELAIGAYYQVAIAARAAAAGDLAASIAGYRRALEVAPDDTEIRRHLAVVLARDRQVEAAKSELETVLAADPDNATAHFLLGTALAAQNDLEAAEASLTRAVDLDPEHLEALSTLGAIAEQKNDLEAAERYYGSVVAIEPQNPAGRFNYGKVLAMAGRPEEARTQFETLLETNPGHGQALLSLGMLLEQGGLAEEALERYRAAAALQNQPQVQGLAFLRQAQLLSQTDSSSDTTDQYQRAVELLPRSFDARFALANALGRLQRYAEAANAFDHALELGADNASAHAGRALSRLFAGEDRQALADLRESLQALPDNVELQHLLARLLATSEVDEVRNGDEALALAQKVAQTQERIDHVETVAMALAELGRFTEATQLQGRILAEARRVGATPLVPAIESRLRLYERAEPVRGLWSRSTGDE